ncbi:U-scoloptoxin(01)-Cw1a-like [Homarus americanus]|uniref:U-scoloptoxin(01)-Cw1a-like 7 n=1 Tax=Homarus americanus TaxID=6706 RepID=A0A8J5JJV9_HOMAM|nr:U-scoloptoxin(01)-Cw1a-like [Homarus americanus]KAG7157376.1 U-scoloptoxin(01)-Cw1a-like 7 [Homarus americanus]
MTRLALAVVLALASVATARMAYQLPADVELYMTAPIQSTFSCDNLPYGYYADVDNNCELFHVCFPVADEIGALVETAHFTFACGNETLFDQETLTCAHRELAFPCSESRSLYELSNVEFFRIPEEI